MAAIPAVPAERDFSSVSEAVKAEARVSLEAALESMTAYHAADTERISGEICRSCMERLQREPRTQGLKYIVHCTVVPKSPGYGLHCSSASLWDGSTDGSCLVRWENDALLAVVTVYGLAV